MALDDFQDDEDPYRQRVRERLDEGGLPTGGIAGPADGGFPAPAQAAPARSPYSSQDRDRIVQGWANSGSQYSNDRAGIEGYLGSLGANHGWRVDRDDKVIDPNGRIFDWIGDVGTSRAAKRTGYTTDSRYASVTGSKPGAKLATAKPIAAPRAGAPTGTPATTPATTATPAAPGGAAPAPATGVSPYQQQLRDFTMQQLQQYSTPVSAEDPAIKAQQDAYRVERSRGADRERSALAERAAFTGELQGGASSGGFDTQLGGIHEAAGQDNASNLAGLMGQEQTQRRAVMQGLLNEAMASGEQESVRSLQMAIAQMDDDLARTQLAQQESQFGRSHAQRGSQFNADLAYRNRVLSQTGSQFDRSLGEQGRQFDDTYGANRADTRLATLQWMVDNGHLTYEEYQKAVAEAR